MLKDQIEINEMQKWRSSLIFATAFQKKQSITNCDREIINKQITDPPSTVLVLSVPKPKKLCRHSNNILSSEKNHMIVHSGISERYK